MNLLGSVGFVLWAEDVAFVVQVVENGPINAMVTGPLDDKHTCVGPLLQLFVEFLEMRIWKRNDV